MDAERDEVRALKAEIAALQRACDVLPAPWENTSRIGYVVLSAPSGLTVRCAPQKGRGISRQLRVPTLSGPVLKTVVRDAPKCGLELTNVDFFFLTNCGYKR
jgi:hypothetical protein